MPSDYEKFWTHSSYAFVGHTAARGFPKLSYGALKKRGVKVYPVDPSVSEIGGDKTYSNLASLPEKVDAVLLEVPKKETADWVRQAADAGVRNVWIHATRDTPEAVSLAKEKGINVLTGTCAVMYLKQGASYHSIHKWINRLLGRY